MSEQEYYFSQLQSAEQSALSTFYKEAMEVNFRESRNAAWELAKVLLTVNSGAAAGLFIVIRSSTENSLLIAAFYTFCFGVFFVVAAYFVGAVQFAGNALKWEEDVQKVFQDKLSVDALIKNQRKRVRGIWSKACRILGWLSFLCIIIGGLTAGKFLVETPSQTSRSTNSSTHQNFIANLDLTNTNPSAPLR